MLYIYNYLLNIMGFLGGAVVKNLPVLAGGFFTTSTTYTACGILIPQPGIEPVLCSRRAES